MRKSNRRGGALVELAVCVPTILLMVLGSIECCSMIFLQQTLKVASYEGTRVAIKFDAENSDVLERCNDMLGARGVASSSVTLSPPDVSQVPRGERITITVSAPCAANSFLPSWFFDDRSLVARCTMVKE